MLSRDKKRTLLTLTFTIGWLKLAAAVTVAAVVTALTFTIGWLKLPERESVSRLGFIFNFHHRVVETCQFTIVYKVLTSLTFTIGWLKPLSSLTAEVYLTAL